MSHWKKFTSNVLTNTNAALLTKALANLGVTLDPTIKNIKNTWGNEQVDAGFVKNGSKIALGIKYVQGEEGTAVELRGDFWSTGLNEATFMDDMAQQYQKEHVIDICENQGWNVDDINTNEKGEIVIGASQWA